MRKLVSGKFEIIVSSAMYGMLYCVVWCKVGVVSRVLWLCVLPRGVQGCSAMFRDELMQFRNGYLQTFVNSEFTLKSLLTDV